MNQNFYIDSFPYEIELTARVCHENARQLLESITDEISIDEFAILDTLTARSGLSQADLARLILKGKAHTGRFLISLEEKGFIERHIEEKNGKLIKVSDVTPKGKKLYNDIVERFKPAVEKFNKIACTPENLLYKALKQKYNSNKWFKTFATIGGIVLAGTVASQFAFGRKDSTIQTK